MTMTDLSEEPAPPLELELLPLDALHRALGARMAPFAGYEMPVQYDGVMPEHLWTRANAGLFDVSHMGQLLLSGKGAAAALEKLAPSDFAGLAAGRMRYSLLLDENGGVLDDFMATARQDGLYLVVNGATKADDIAHLREHLADEIDLNYMEDQALLAVQGPKAADALARLVPGVAALTFMTAAAFQFEGAPLWISRSGYTGEDGFEISVPTESAEALARALLAQPEVRPIGLGARDSLRLEAGLPLYGHDLDTGTDPVSAGLAFAISKRRRQEGGFVGAETILAALRDGPATKRVGLALDGRQPAREGAPVFAGGRQVGRVTSGGFAPSLGAPVAMAYVAADQAAVGTALEIEVRGKRLAATVTPTPFVPHKYVRQGAAR
jgi:aminomethyltransferase